MSKHPSLTDQFKFTGKSILISLYASMAIMLIFVIPRRFHPLTKSFMLDLPISKNTTALESYDTETGLIRFSFDITWDLCFYSYFYGLINFYISFRERDRLFLLVLSILGYIMFSMARTSYGASSIKTAAVSLLPSAFLGIGLKFILPRDSRVSRELLWPYLSLNFLLVAYSMYLETKGDFQQSEMFRLTMICFVFPFFKELIFSINRSTARKLSLDPTIAGTNVKVNPQVTYGIYLWAQISWSLIVRGVLVNFGNPTMFALGVIFQNVTELSLRCTVKFRDDMTQRIFLRLCPGRSSIVSPSQVVDKYITDVDEDQRDFYSRFLVCEMISEYIAMFVITLMVFVYQNQMLAYPHNIYVVQNNPFTEPVSVSLVLGGLFIQLASEIFVDILVLQVELKRGYPILEAFNSLVSQPQFFITLTMSSVFAMAIYSAFVNSGSKTNECSGEDICLCSDGHGLDPQGLLQMFCNYTK